ncbi:hypothetical protein BWQ96_01411 [Gracilariopsis chorda]|uniref:Uncharacterized protein n=1 Tax=Gracilariopsis chorda TaxID=448386 RepID=A0A2V3J390_9FLOR|nr:hypothetical protein BWQ96_01411 [Gracilariopsis chorda]|eukprot:PXF48855.1 hypothetical protein BWQ96_01411 [Gracilariopsis chorda]
MKQRIVLFNNLTPSEDTPHPHGDSANQSLKFVEGYVRVPRGESSNPLKSNHNMRGRKQYPFNGFPSRTTHERLTAGLFSSKSAHTSGTRLQTSPDENRHTRFVDEKSFASQDRVSEDISLYLGQRSTSKRNCRNLGPRSPVESTWLSGGRCRSALICLTCMFFSLWYFKEINETPSEGNNPVRYLASRISLDKFSGASNITQGHTRSKTLWIDHVVQGDQNQILIPETFESRFNNEIAPLLDNHLDRVWGDNALLRCPNGEQTFAMFSLKEAENLPATISFGKQCSRMKQLNPCFQEHEVSDLRQLQIQVPSKSSLSSYSVTILINRSADKNSEESPRDAQVLGVAQGTVQIVLSDLSKLALKRYCSRQRHHFADDATSTSNSENDIRLITLYELKRLYGVLSRRKLDTGYFSQLWDVHELSKATIDPVQHSRHRRAGDKESFDPSSRTTLPLNESEITSSSLGLEHQKNRFANASETDVWEEFSSFNRSGNKNSSERLAPSLEGDLPKEQNQSFNSPRNITTSEGNENGVESVIEQLPVTKEDQDEPRGADDGQQESELEAESEDDEDTSTINVSSRKKNESAFSKTSADDGKPRITSEHSNSIQRTESMTPGETLPDSHAVSASTPQNRSDISTASESSSGQKTRESVRTIESSSVHGAFTQTAIDTPQFVDEDRSSQNAPETTPTRPSSYTNGPLTQSEVGTSQFADSDRDAVSSQNVRETTGAAHVDPVSQVDSPQLMDNTGYAYDSRQESSLQESGKPMQDAFNSEASNSPGIGMPVQHMYRDLPRVYRGLQRGVSSSQVETQAHAGISGRAPLRRSTMDLSYDSDTARTRESQEHATGPNFPHTGAHGTMVDRNSRVTGNLITASANRDQYISMQSRESDLLQRRAPMRQVPRSIPDRQAAYRSSGIDNSHSKLQGLIPRHYPMEAKSSNSMGRKPSRYPGRQSPTVRTENRQGSRGLQYGPSRDQRFPMREQPQTAVAQMMQQGFRGTAIAGHSNHSPEEGLTQPSLADGDPQRIYRKPYAQKGPLEGTHQAVNRRMFRG